MNQQTKSNDRISRIWIIKACAALATVPLLLYAYATGPDPRKTSAPGDSLCTEAGCHVGTANSGGGRVEIVFPNGLAYTPGVKQSLIVRVTDSAARIYGFQATARLASNLSGGQAGDFTSSDTSTLILCDNGREKPAAGCGSAPVQFIEHRQARSTNSYSFDWTPPATNVGNVRIYVAGNAGNGNGLADNGDHIYTANYILTPATITPPPPPSGTSYSISQIADGTGWKTTIVLTNLDSVPASYTLRFWKGDGTALTLPLGANGSGVQQLTGTIPVNGSQTIDSPGTANTLLQGWGELTSSNAMGGTAIFRQRVSGRSDSEGSVSLTAASSKRLLLPFDNTQGFVTSLALVNPDTSRTATIAATFYDETGNQIAADSLSLPAHGQLPFAMPDRFPQVANKRGVAQFSTTDINLTGLGLRFSGAGSFTSVAFLTPPATDAPTETLISQLVQRANWRTTMILVNSDSAPSVFTIRFRNMDGTSLLLPVLNEGPVTELTGVIPGNGARFIETDDALAEALLHGWAELSTPNGITATTLVSQRLHVVESEISVPFHRSRQLQIN